MIKKINFKNNVYLLYTYTYGPPMAVAPLNKVIEVIDYAVTVIDPRKILIGIPNYGYDWTLPFEVGTKARSISNVGAVELARETGSSILYDETAKSPYFYYTDESGSAHVVWFEDARSIEEKLLLISMYGLLGCGVWNIMKFFPQNWLVLNSMFNIYKAL